MSRDYLNFYFCSDFFFFCSYINSTISAIFQVFFFSRIINCYLFFGKLFRVLQNGSRQVGREIQLSSLDRSGIAKPSFFQPFRFCNIKLATSLPPLLANIHILSRIMSLLNGQCFLYLQAIPMPALTGIGRVLFCVCAKSRFTC